jgi:urease accessory protein UreF
MEQLGAPNELAMLNVFSDAFVCPKIRDFDSLSVFLEAYQKQRLYPVEWPAIIRAHSLACHNHSRELIALDQGADAGGHAGFARASRWVGRRQLERLRPLRDHRVVQRYLEAVDARQAEGWHTLVYGVTLAVYSLPLRQGLMNYARQTLNGFIEAAGRSLQIPDEACQELLERRCHSLNEELGKLMRGVVG